TAPAHRSLHLFPTRRSSDLKLKAIAKFIGAPLLATMLLAEQVKPKDFYQSEGDDDSDIQNKIDRAVRYILSDPDWGSVAPKALRSEEHTSELQSRFDLVCRL